MDVESPRRMEAEALKYSSWGLSLLCQVLEGPDAGDRVLVWVEPDRLQWVSNLLAAGSRVVLTVESWQVVGEVE